MAKFDSKTVEHLGKLARIGLSKQEVNSLKADLGSILAYVQKLQSVDTSKTTPTSQVTGLVDVWREDEPHADPADPKELLKNAPQSQNGYIKVKKVL